MKNLRNINIYKILYLKNIYFYIQAGHADFKSLEHLCQLVKPKIIIPIHGERPEAFKEMNLEKCNIIIGQDGEKIEIWNNKVTQKPHEEYNI